TFPEVAFVCRLSGRDSSIDARSFREKATVSHLPKASENNRLFDPVVSVFDYKTRRLTLIDYGWAPVFSTNNNRLAYAYQLNPLQKQDRLYAQAYQGNSIRVFNRSARHAEEVARPLNSYLLSPFFTDSLKLIY